MSTLRAVHYLELCTDFIGSDGFRVGQKMMSSGSYSVQNI